MKKTETLMGRRSFLKGAVLAGVAASAGLVGCTSAAAPASAGAGQDAAADIKPEETKDCDICVVGAGISGLAACVKAAQQGAKVIVLEAAGSAGGNGLGVEERGLTNARVEANGSESPATWHKIEPVQIIQVFRRQWRVLPSPKSQFRFHETRAAFA